MVTPRLRARSVSSGSGPSWSSRNRVSSARSPSSLGPTPTAVRTRSASNWSRVRASTKPGNLSMALRMTSTCSALICPRAWAAAVAGSTGSSGWPVKCPSWSQQRGLGQPAVRFGCRDPPPDREHVLPRLGAHLLRCRLGLQPGQHPVALGGQLAGQGLQFVADGRAVRRGVSESRSQAASASCAARNAATAFLHHRPGHTSNIRATTDKPRRDVTTETTVTQGITTCA